jgi:hypothetical protein
MKISPIIPKKEESGIISICKLNSKNITATVVNAVLAESPRGSACIAVRINEER